MNWFLALLGRSFIACVQALPIEVVARIGRAGGLLAWWVDARHRRVTLDNLERVFGRVWDAQRRRAIGRENFQRLGEGYLCGLKTPRLSAEEMRERLTIEGFLEALPEGGGSAVFAIGHFGNFEIFTRVKELAPEWTVATTYRALRQPALNALFQSVRAISGVRFFERRSEARILRQTIEGGHVVLGILADQHAGDKGLWLDFLGHPCSCSAAPALFALRYGTPLGVGVCFRTGLARWKLEFSRPLKLHDSDGKPLSLEAITREINAHYEAAIRRDPANWFWVHRRWKPMSAAQQRRQATGVQGATSEPAEDVEA